MPFAIDGAGIAWLKLQKKSFMKVERISAWISKCRPKNLTTNEGIFLKTLNCGAPVGLIGKGLYFFSQSTVHLSSCSKPKVLKKKQNYKGVVWSITGWKLDNISILKGVMLNEGLEDDDDKASHDKERTWCWLLKSLVSSPSFNGPQSS